uniref:BRCA1 associated RING domain 1 n=1 Tax=Lepisosteus oculatus TaxID=7918 RepID=W5MAD5_LEPOC|nr:PREDICTED: BRCA1-associated RING domain protein 1 isoform X2 [Lepisosteus oculatus]
MRGNWTAILRSHSGNEAARRSMDRRLSPQAEAGSWTRTRQSVEQLRSLLLCCRCENLLSEPVCLGACEHVFCRTCAVGCVSEGCSVCHTPVWLTDLQINRQLDSITQHVHKLESLLHCGGAASPQAGPAARSLGRHRKNFRIWFSPRSRKVRCRLERGGSGAPDAQAEAGRPAGPAEASVFDFAASSSSQSSAEGRKRKHGARPATRGKPKGGVSKRQRLKRVNREWGVQTARGPGAKAAEEEEEEGLEGKQVTSKKAVSFLAPDVVRGAGDPEGPRAGPSQREGARRSSLRVAVRAPQTGRDGAEEPAPSPGPAGEPAPLPPQGTGSAGEGAPLRPRRGTRSSAQGSPRTPWRSPGCRAGASSSPPPAGPCVPPVPKKARVGPESGAGGEGGREPAPHSPRRRAPLRRGSSASPGQAAPPGRLAAMKKNFKGETPLHLAAIKGDVQAVQELLSSGTDPNLKDHAGWTPLHEACNHGHLPVVEVLLQQGALLNTPGYQNDSPLHDAVRNGHTLVVGLLLEHGASQDVVNIFGLRPADYAETPEMKALLQATPQGTPTPLQSPKTSLSKVRGFGSVTVLGSKLTKPQLAQLSRLGRVLGVGQAESFTSAVTHVVVADGPMPTTLSCLLAVLNGCWILKFQWVEHSLKAGTLAPESDYEVGEGAQRSRVNRENMLPRLFDGCFFFLRGSFRRPPRDELLRLAREGGGRVLLRQPKPDSDVTQTVAAAAYHAPPGSDQRSCTQYVLYDRGSAYRPPRVRLGKVWSAPSAWLLDCIAAFRLLPVPEPEPQPPGPLRAPSRGFPAAHHTTVHETQVANARISPGSVPLDL